MISSGLYNQTIVLQSSTLTNDDMGGVTKAWADQGSFRARISTLSSQERSQQDRTTNFITHRIYCDPMLVLPDDRFKWGTYYFEILGITNPSEAYRHLEIDVRETNYP